MANSQRGSHDAESRWTQNRKRFTGAITGFFKHPKTVPCEYLPQKYSYIFRRKSRCELASITAIASGIEFCYAAETAYVSPVLLSLGLNVKYTSMIWCLSPLIAFITTPILGSLSDSCDSRFGRRRPLISILSVGVIIGLIFVPYGGRLGLMLGDAADTNRTDLEDFVPSTNLTGYESPHRHPPSREIRVKVLNDSFSNLTAFENIPGDDFDNLDLDDAKSNPNIRVFGIVITVVGAVILDFCVDVCQSPCRAYLLDITLPEEHEAGLAVFSLNSGLGAAVGYGIAAVKWDIPLWENVLEGQVVVVFAIVAFLYLIFLAASLCSFPEIPMPLLRDASMFKEYQMKMKGHQTQYGSEMNALYESQSDHSSLRNDKGTPRNKNAKDVDGTIETNHGISTKTRARNDPATEEDAVLPSSTQAGLTGYLKSILLVPKSLRVLCMANFFYGMGIMSYTVFFTDFVGGCVFGGDPRAPKDSGSYELYEEGVRFGCWGMAVSALTCVAYSNVVEDLAKRFGTKIVFVGGALVYSAGMVLMAVTGHKVSAIILSSTAGVMLATLSTVPYILVAQYHTSLKFQESIKKEDCCTRGLGTDVATVIGVIVLSQCVLSLSMGTVVESMGSNRVVIYSAALLSACGAILATQVMYYEM